MFIKTVKDIYKKKYLNMNEWIDVQVDINVTKAEFKML